MIDKPMSSDLHTTTFASSTSATSTNLTVVFTMDDVEAIEAERKRKLKGIRQRDERARWRRSW